MLIIDIAMLPISSYVHPLFSLSESPRIVTLYQEATDYSIARGQIPIHVVDSWLKKPMYHYLRAPLDSIDHMGLKTYLNLEKSVQFSPNLVIAPLCHARIAQLLNTIASTTAASTVFDFKAMITMTRTANAANLKAEIIELFQYWGALTAAFRLQNAAELDSNGSQ